MFKSLFKSNSPTEATPSPAQRIAPKPVQPPTAPANRTSTIPDTKVAYLSSDELNSTNLTPLFEVAEGPALVMGYVSPDNDMHSVSSSIKRVLPPNAKLILVTTSGELCRPAGSRTLYCEASDNRRKVLLQVFSRRMIDNMYVMTIKLPNDDLRQGQVSISVEERVSRMQRKSVGIRFRSA